MARQHSPTAVLLRRCWDMDRGKRASMREGPLSALFRDTAALDENGNEVQPEAQHAPAPAPRAAPRARARRAAAGRTADARAAGRAGRADHAAAARLRAASA